MYGGGGVQNQAKKTAKKCLPAGTGTKIYFSSYSKVDTRRLDTSRIRINAGLRCVRKWFLRGSPFCGTPPYDNSSLTLPGGNYAKCQRQKSAQGILRLRNPNLGPNSGKRILDARILDPNSRVEFFDSVFSSKRGPLKNSPSRNSPPEIHIEKFTPEFGPKNSHCTSTGPFC